METAGEVTHRQNGLPIALAALPDQHAAAGPVDSHAPSPRSSGPPAKPVTEAEILKLARMRAMLRLIKWEENGPVSDDTAYHARFGGRDPMSDADMLNYEPKPEYFRFDGRLEPFTAAGAYQILGDTWRRISKILGTSDFTPENQDRAAIVLIDEYRAEGDVEAGRLRQAINKLKGQWVSLPGGTQSHTSIAEATQKFNSYASEETQRIKEEHQNAK